MLCFPIGLMFPNCTKLATPYRDGSPNLAISTPMTLKHRRFSNVIQKSSTHKREWGEWKFGFRSRLKGESHGHNRSACLASPIFNEANIKGRAVDEPHHHYRRGNVPAV